MNWIVLVLLSALLVSIGNIIRTYVLRKEHSLEFLAARGFFVIPLILLLTPFIDIHLNGLVLLFIYLSSLATTAGYYYQTKAARHIELSLYSPFDALTPLLLVVLAFFFLGESLSAVEIVGIIAIAIGSFILASRPGAKIGSLNTDLTRHNLAMMGLAMLFLAIAGVLDKRLLGVVHPGTYLFFILLFTSIHYVLLDAVQYGWEGLTNDFKKGWHWLLLSALCFIGGSLAFYAALGTVGVFVALAFPLKRTNIILDTMFGGSFLHEQDLPRRLFACFIMVAGLILIIM